MPNADSTITLAGDLRLGGFRPGGARIHFGNAPCNRRPCGLRQVPEKTHEIRYRLRGLVRLPLGDECRAMIERILQEEVRRTEGPPAIWGGPTGQVVEAVRGVIPEFWPEIRCQDASK